MNHSLYVFSNIFHVFAAVTWVGGMLFLVFILMPALRSLEDPVLRGRLIRQTGIRFRLVGWTCLITLGVTGFLNLLSRGVTMETMMTSEFWMTPYGHMLLTKISVFTLILGISATHDFLIGPRAAHIRRTAPDSPETARLRLMGTWFGRLNLLLSLGMILLGVLLVRGLPW